MPRLWFSTLLRSLGFLAVLFGSLLAAAAYSNTFFDNIESIKKLAFLPALSETLQAVQVGGDWGYMAGQHFFKGCNTMGVAAAVLFAVGAVAGERERGTFEVWLARPVSRNTLLLERWIAGALAVVVPVFVTSLSINWMLEVSGREARIPTWLLWLGSVHESILLLAIYSVTFFLSVIGENPIRIAFGMLFALMATFSIYLIEGITQYSLFRLADVWTFLAINKTGGLNWLKCGPMLALIALALGASLWQFRRRIP